jgi:hypothetical protein
LSAKFFADFSTDEVEEEDEIEKALKEGAYKTQFGEEPEVVATEKNHGSERHRPGPTKAHEQSARRCEEEDGEDEEELRIMSADSADDDDDGEQKQIERDRDETRKGQEFAPGRRREIGVYVGGRVGLIDRRRCFGSRPLVAHKECM